MEPYDTLLMKEPTRSLKENLQRFKDSDWVESLNVQSECSKTTVAYKFYVGDLKQA